MAHIAKFKADSVKKLCDEYNRWYGDEEKIRRRPNIDLERTPQNYRIVLDVETDKASAETVRRRIAEVDAAAAAAAKRRTRKDAVVMADIVVTLPPNVPEADAQTFFGEAYDFIASKVGDANVMGGYVHMDETTPHMHVPFTPILDGRFNFKGLCPRSFYQSFHKELGDYLEEKMGYRPEVELSDETRARRLYAERTADIDRVKDATERLVVAPAEAKAQALEREAQAERDSAHVAAQVLRDEAQADRDEARALKRSAQAERDSARDEARQTREEAAATLGETQDLLAQVQSILREANAAKNASEAFYEAKLKRAEQFMAQLTLGQSTALASFQARERIQKHPERPTSRADIEAKAQRLANAADDVSRRRSLGAQRPGYGR